MNASDAAERPDHLRHSILSTFAIPIMKANFEPFCPILTPAMLTPVGDSRFHLRHKIYDVERLICYRKVATFSSQQRDRQEIVGTGD